jgi:hypothetical protein
MNIEQNHDINVSQSIPEMIRNLILQCIAGTCDIQQIVSHLSYLTVDFDCKVSTEILRFRNTPFSTEYQSSDWYSNWKNYLSTSREIKPTKTKVELKKQLELFFQEKDVINITKLFREWIQKIENFELMENIIFLLNEMTSLLIQKFSLKKSHLLKDLVRKHVESFIFDPNFGDALFNIVQKNQKYNDLILNKKLELLKNTIKNTSYPVYLNHKCKKFKVR